MHSGLAVRKQEVKEWEMDPFRYPCHSFKGPRMTFFVVEMGNFTLPFPPLPDSGETSVRPSRLFGVTAPILFLPETRIFAHSRAESERTFSAT